MTVSGVLTRIEGCIPALRRYATALLRNREDADDLVHDCLVRALDKLHTRRDDADVRAWLFAIMHNLFISQLRRAKARPAGECWPGSRSNHTLIRRCHRHIRSNSTIL